MLNSPGSSSHVRVQTSLSEPPSGHAASVAIARRIQCFHSITVQHCAHIQRLRIGGVLRLCPTQKSGEHHG